MSKPLDIAIAGAGIAGLAAAIGLARHGHAVRVFERAAAIEEFGAGLQIGPNAATALEKLGVWREVERITHVPGCIAVRDGVSGEPLTTIELSGVFENRFGKPYRVAHRGDLLQALLEASRGHANIEIHTGAEVTGFDDTDTVKLDLADGPTARADVLIGADGIRSAVRRRIFPHTAIRDAGHTIFRSLIPTSAAPETADLANVTLWLCPNGHVVQYPLNRGRLNLVAIHESAQTIDGWRTPASPGEVSALFRACCPALLALLEAPQSWRKWPGADIEPSAPWGDGNVTLIGDAAHASLPYLAQGAAMALEDAATLSDLLAEPAGEVSDVLRRYESHRHVRTARIVHQSRRMGRVYHMTGMAAAARNQVMRSMPDAYMLKRIAWIYQWT